MPLLKDTEREQLRQLVKACLLEISKLKIELKKCQKESSKSTDTESIQINAVKEEFQDQIVGKNDEIARLNLVIQEKEDKIAELEKIRVYFETIISRPKKDLTSFQSQIYELLPLEEDTSENLYAKLKNIGFTDLSNENFEHALRNLERKGYFESRNDGDTSIWKKLYRKD
ncbi:MAG TPA: putative peptidoglycan binding domain-containing protein [Methanobacterium sp.]|nr:putative peptidoglycan binding domain-containing protein [Methanobacterium sp.]